MSSNMRFYKVEWADDFGGVFVDSEVAEYVLSFLYDDRSINQYLVREDNEDETVFYFENAGHLRKRVLDLCVDDLIEDMEENSGLLVNKDYVRDIQLFVENLKSLVQVTSFDQIQIDGSIRLSMDT